MSVNAIHVRHLGTALFAVLLLWSSGALAESRLSAVEGHVVDPTGAAVPKATVVVLNTRTGEWRMTKEQKDGQYRIEGLPAGRYEVTAVSQGFVRDDRDVRINPERESSLDLHLGVGRGSGPVVTALHQGEPPGAFEELYIGGEVLGPDGHGLAGVRVIAENLKTGETHATTSDSAGLFVLKGFPTGTYRLKAEAEGYRAQYRLASPTGYGSYSRPQAQFHLEPDSK